VGGQPELAEPWSMAAFGGEPGADGESCQHCCLGTREEASGWPRIRRLQSIHGFSRSAPPAARRVSLSGVLAPAGGTRAGDADGAGGRNFASGTGGRCAPPRILHIEPGSLPPALSLPWPPYGAARMLVVTGGM
jgi:hypothetical protein